MEFLFLVGMMILTTMNLWILSLLSNYSLIPELKMFDQSFSSPLLTISFILNSVQKSVKILLSYKKKLQSSNQLPLITKK